MLIERIKILSVWILVVPPRSPLARALGPSLREHLMPPFSPSYILSVLPLSDCGPGILISVSYIDPGNLESDLQAGNSYGRSLLWVLLWATVIALIVQSQAIRLGVATGASLARAMREEYPWYARVCLWALIEIAIAIIDVPEVRWPGPGAPALLIALASFSEGMP